MSGLSECTQRVTLPDVSLKKRRKGDTSAHTRHKKRYRSLEDTKQTPPSHSPKGYLGHFKVGLRFNLSVDLAMHYKAADLGAREVSIIFKPVFGQKLDDLQ